MKKLIDYTKILRSKNAGPSQTPLLKASQSSPLAKTVLSPDFLLYQSCNNSSAR